MVRGSHGVNYRRVLEDGGIHLLGMLTLLWGMAHESGFGMADGVETLVLKCVFWICLLWHLTENA